MGFYSGLEVLEQNPRDWYNEPPKHGEVREMASGGRVYGPQPGTDLIPVWIDDGYIIPASDADKYAPVLARINAGWHEGEGCTGDACCCDQTELEI